MSSTELEAARNGRQLSPRVAGPDRVGQATAVEQSRAVAQVEAQVVVARRFPRNVPAALNAMREACAQQRLAEKAFYRYPRGKDQWGKPVIISGPSINLATELARIWGNIEYGVHEMRRDDAAGQSEMLAFAWDLETNARNSTVFINPHMRDKTGGPEPLTDMRDIYEVNANSGARRVRETIFRVLPTWFVEEAIDLLNKTLSGQAGGKTLAQRAADAISAFAKFGVTAAQIETKLGRKSADWLDQDMAQLMVIYRSLERGEISRDEEFPTDRVTAADITGQPAVAPAPPAAGPSQDAEAGAETGQQADSKPRGGKQARNNSGGRLGQLLAHIPLGTDEEIGDFLAWRTNRMAARAVDDLTPAEVEAIAAYLDQALAGNDGNATEAGSMIWTQFHQERDATTDSQQ